MSGPGCSRADNLGHRREIQAHDAVLEELDAIKTEEPGSHGSQSGKQERARTMRRLPAQVVIQARPNRNVQRTAAADPMPDLIYQALLGCGDLSRRAMADERDRFAIRNQFLKRSSKGVQPAREQDDLVGREGAHILAGELKVALCSWLVVQ